MNAHVAHDVMTGLMHAAFQYFNSNDNKSHSTITLILVEPKPKFLVEEQRKLDF